MGDGISRRAALALGAVAAGGAMAASTAAGAVGVAEGRGRDYLRPDAGKLRRLYDDLAAMRRRREFARLPMILTTPKQWDATPLDALLGYTGPRQVFDSTDLAGTWINQIRNTVNAQVWAFRRPDFLVVAAPHGAAGYALFTQAAWTKYGLAALTDGVMKRNTLLRDPPFPRAAMDQPENGKGLYSSAAGNTIPVLQKRGVVFLACHNAIWELASVLIASGVNPDGRTQGELAADLTDSLIPGVVTTPGNEATIGLLQQAGYSYSFAEA